ncbi:MAG TPA: hypothetical protein VF520_13545 [Thermoleophilaceae bacterium]|jgi:hypothetical protein
MGAHSNRNLLSGLLVAAALAFILVVGLAAAPRAFEFRTKPESSRRQTTQRVVNVPAPTRDVVHVAGVSRSSDETAARLGRTAPRPQRGDRAGRARTGRGDRSGSPRGRSHDRGGSRVDAPEGPGSGAPPSQPSPPPTVEAPQQAPAPSDEGAASGGLEDGVVRLAETVLPRRGSGLRDGVEGPDAADEPSVASDAHARRSRRAANSPDP